MVEVSEMEVAALSAAAEASGAVEAWEGEGTLGAKVRASVAEAALVAA